MGLFCLKSSIQRILNFHRLLFNLLAVPVFFSQRSNLSFILGEQGFCVVGGQAGAETEICRFHVPIPGIHADDFDVVDCFHSIFLSKFRFLRTYSPSPLCALDSSDARQRIGAMGVSPLRFRPALSRSIIVLPPPSSPCWLLSGSGCPWLSLA